MNLQVRKKKMNKNRYYDNSRLSSHRECPRKDYYRNERDWVPERIGLPLVFGGAWHAAMDIVWPMCQRNETDEMIGALAYDAWCKHWTDEDLPIDLTPEQAEQWNPRIPSTAMEMLYEYIRARRNFIRDIEIIQIEKPFAVPIDPNDSTLFYIGRIDKVIRWQGKVWGVEHKTSSAYKKDGYFRSDFVDSFSPNSQIDGYMHALRMEYGDEAKGILVDAALVHKTVHEGFMFIPVERQTDMLQQWLFETMYEVQLVERNIDARWNGPTTDILSAFPKHTGSCHNWGGCPYLDLCKGMKNPEQETTPLGFKEEHWEPFDVLNIEKLGLER